jgi:hypothetical protein
VAGCEFSLDPANASVGSTGGTVSVNLARTNGVSCPWTASSNDAFITIQSGASGTDTGTTVLAVAANTGIARTGTATVAGRIVTISQAAPAGPCVFAVTPSVITVSSAGGTTPVTLTVTSGVNCPWIADASASFITVSSLAGVGGTTLTVTVAPNTGSPRIGTVTVAGQPITVTQAASGSVAVLSYESEPGDYIGKGLSNSFTLSSSQFQVTVNPTLADLTFTAPGIGPWSLFLKSASGPLVPGTYVQAAGSMAGVPGLNFSGSGRGCNQVTGRFLVQTAVFSGSSVVRFHARFEQHCEGASTPLRGQIWIDTAGGLPPALADFPPPPAMPFTQITYTSDAGDPIAHGASGTLTLAGMKFTAWDLSAAPAVQIRAESATGLPTPNWTLTFKAVSGTLLLPGTYTGAGSYPYSVGIPEFSVAANGVSCGVSMTGSFVVLEAVYGPQGEVLRFHATFEQHCNGTAPALRGEVWIVADPWR